MLADFDDATIGITNVAAHLVSAVVDGRRDERDTARRPLFVHRLDVRHADVHEGIESVRVERRAERNLGLVRRAATAFYDDHPGVRELDVKGGAKLDHRGGGKLDD